MEPIPLDILTGALRAFRVGTTGCTITAPRDAVLHEQHLDGTTTTLTLSDGYTITWKPGERKPDDPDPVLARV